MPRRSHILPALLLVATAIASAHVPRPPARKTLQPPRRMLACLLSQPVVKHDLKTIGLPTIGTAAFRARFGVIPFTSPATSQWNVLIVSRNGRRGWLLFVRRAKDGATHAFPNAYFLRRDHVRWSAGEGNGGLWTYRAMGRYADSLTHSPLIAALIPQQVAAGCVEDF